MNERRLMIWLAVGALLMLFLLGVSVRGPEAALDWILARIDMFIAWAFGKG